MNIENALNAIRQRWPGEPRAGIILGTGLGELAEHVNAEAIIDYDDIPGFGKSTALAHRGRLICGHLAGVPVVVMQGRVHLYEGYSPRQVALPVRVMQALGAQVLIVTNANGGLNPKFTTGDVVVMDDHINLMFQPVGWVKRADTEQHIDCQDYAGATNGSPAPTHQGAAFWRGARCVGEDLAHPTPTPYDQPFIETALTIARRENFTAYRGVYIAVTGPSYETRAEYRMLRKFGDCVGMSTVPEVLTAVECGMRVLGLSIVTNVARPDAPEKVDAEEVLHDAAGAGVNVQKIILGVLASLSP